jgi:hypothetical protein
MRGFSTASFICVKVKAWTEVITHAKNQLSQVHTCILSQQLFF